jgi:hypothetical protein
MAGRFISNKIKQQVIDLSTVFRILSPGLIIVRAGDCNGFGGDVGKSMEALSDRLPELSATGPAFLRPGVLLSYPFPISCLPSILKKRWQVVDLWPGGAFLRQTIVVISQQQGFRCVRAFHNVASKWTFNGVSANFCF